MKFKQPLKEGKYIISLFGEQVIFDKEITHTDIKIRARSAGFVRIWIDDTVQRIRVCCYGESLSLGLCSSSLNDEKIIEAFLNGE